MKPAKALAVMGLLALLWILIVWVAWPVESREVEALARGVKPASADINNGGMAGATAPPSSRPPKTQNAWADLHAANGPIPRSMESVAPETLSPERRSLGNHPVPSFPARLEILDANQLIKANDIYVTGPGTGAVFFKNLDGGDDFSIPVWRGQAQWDQSMGRFQARRIWIHEAMFELTQEPAIRLDEQNPVARIRLSGAKSLPNPDAQLHVLDDRTGKPLTTVQIFDEGPYFQLNQAPRAPQVQPLIDELEDAHPVISRSSPLDLAQIVGDQFVEAAKKSLKERMIVSSPGYHRVRLVRCPRYQDTTIRLRPAGRIRILISDLALAPDEFRVEMKGMGKTLATTRFKTDPIEITAVPAGSYRLRIWPTIHPLESSALFFASDIEVATGETCQVQVAGDGSDRPEEPASVVLRIEHNDAEAEGLMIANRRGHWLDASQTLRATVLPYRWSTPSDFASGRGPTREKTFHNVDPGLYFLRFNALNYSQRVRARAGETTRVTVDLREYKKFEFSFRAIDGEGQLVGPWDSDWAMTWSKSPEPSVTSIPNHTFSVTTERPVSIYSPPGMIHLQSKSPGWKLEPTEIRLEPSIDKPIQITFKPEP